MLKQITFLIFSLFTAQLLWAGEIITSVDRNPIRLDESFQITLFAKGDVNGEPDFSILKNHFSILGAPKAVSRIQNINGKVTSEKSWSVVVVANEIGDHEIPAIQVGQDYSKPIKIKIVKAQDAVATKKDVFLATELSSDEVFVQERVVYTVRLFLSVAIGNAKLSEPEIKGADATIDKLGEDKRYRTRIDRKEYEVIERQYLLIPQSSGQLEFTPITFQAVLGLRGGFFANPFSQQTRTIVRRSDKELLRVKPIPTGFSGDYWLPTDQLILHESWSEEPPVFKVGEPITRTITIQAKGLAASQLPELTYSLPSELKAYPDQASLSNDLATGDIIGRRVEKMAINPLESGEMTLPEIKVDYWLKSENGMAQATIPARPIEVLPGQAISNDVITHKETIDKAVIDENNSIDEPIILESTEKIDTSINIWFWISVFISLLWLVTLFLLWRIRRSFPVSNIGRNSETNRALLKKIEVACLQDDASACKTALLTWAKCYFSESAPTNLQELSSRIGGAMEQSFQNLNQSLYAKSSAIWRGDTFWQEFKALIKNLDEADGSKAEVELEPLFKLS